MDIDSYDDLYGIGPSFRCLLQITSYRSPSMPHILRLGRVMLGLLPLALQPAATAEIPPLKPTWTTRDTQLVVDRLNLTGSDSAEIIARLLKDYETQWVAGRAALTAEAGKNTPKESAIEAVRAFQSLQRQLSKTLTTDIEVILTPEQRQPWSRLQDEMWRLRRLRFGQLTGESYELSSRFASTNLAQSIAEPLEAQTIIDNWSSAIAPLLASREPFDIEGPTRFRYLVMERRNDEAFEYLMAWVDIRVSIRDRTLEAVEQLAKLMPSEHASEFALAIEADILPFKPRRRPVDRLHRKLCGDDSISVEEQASIHRIYSVYLLDVAELEMARQEIERSLQPATMRSQMQRRTGRPTLVPQLQQARLENELAFQQRSNQALLELCEIVDDEGCDSSPPPTRRSPQSNTAVDRSVHPSGLPSQSDGSPQKRPKGPAITPTGPRKENPGPAFPECS